MRDPRSAIAQWWGLVKPGGVLFVIVPDEDLYEQGFWPSRFNCDHKWTFTIAKHVKSNAIVFAKNGQTAGIGAGQMNRRDSARIAAMMLL